MHEPNHPESRRPRRAGVVAGIAAIGMLSLTSCSSGHPHASPITTTQSTGSDSTTPSSTSTTVMGPSGPPADYPAAQSTPPSLAGAYPTGTTVNLVTVIKTLTTYEDWVWSHPDPSLVANYEVETGNTYTGEVRVLTQFGQEGLRAQPLPTEIDFVRVASPAVPESLADGKPVMAGKYRVFRGAIVTVVFNEKPTVMLTSSGAPAGQDFTPSHLGSTAYSISLVQGADGRFRFDDTTQLNPPGGIASVEGS